MYSDAIEYYGYMDQHEKCLDLQMRMQGILVKPYILDCLSRFEKDTKDRVKLEQKPVILKQEQMVQQRNSLQQSTKTLQETPPSFGVALTEVEESSSSSSDDEGTSDCDKTCIVKVRFNLQYEVGAQTIQLPEYIQQ